ncbi:MAG: sugar transferase [Planctomycetota bacterium]
MAVRIFDLLVSGFLLVLTGPIFAAVAVLIKLDSPGPVFFLQERVGRGWRRFRMFKFRKMFQEVGTNGPGLTARYDPRVTRVGSWLERTKLDELPQLINVFLGQMSLVGPRPELPRFTGEPHRELWDAVLSVRPGIFGPSQIAHRNESELYPEDCKNVEAFYVEHILPAKLERDAAYARRKSLWYDLGILLRGVWASLTGTVTRDTVVTRRWQVAYLLGSVVLGEVTLAAAFFLRFNWAIPAEHMPHLGYGLILMAIARFTVFLYFRVHRSVHAYFTLSDAMRICASVAVGTVAGVAGQVMLDFRALSRSVFVVDAVLLTTAMIAASYLIDRSLEVIRRDRARRRRLIGHLASWGVLAGVTGAVSMFAAAVVMWPSVFFRDWLRVLALIWAAFAVRTVTSPVLFWRLRGCRNLMQILAGHTRRLVGYLLLAFVGDVTAVFFLDFRGLSRGTVVASTILYAPLFLMLLMAKCHAERRESAEEKEPVAPGSREARRVLVVGDGRETALLISALKHGRDEFTDVVGVVTDDPTTRTHHVSGVEVVGTTQNLSALIEARRPTLAIVLKNTIRRAAFRATVRACREAGVDIRLVPSIMQLVEPPSETARQKADRAPAQEVEVGEGELS